MLLISVEGNSSTTVAAVEVTGAVVTRTLEVIEGRSLAVVVRASGEVVVRVRRQVAVVQGIKLAGGLEVVAGITAEEVRIKSVSTL